MKEFIISASLRYSGRQAIKITIKAEDQKAAEAKFDELDLWDTIRMDEADIEVENFMITSDEEAHEIVPRCPHTKDLF